MTPVTGEALITTTAQLEGLADQLRASGRFGFDTELWTCRRLGQLIGEEWDVHMNVRYLAQWLRQRGFTPQKPQRIPREAVFFHHSAADQVLLNDALQHLRRA